MEPAQSPKPAGAPLAASRASLRDRRDRPHLAPQLAPGMLRPADHAARIERYRLWSDGERTTNHNPGQSSPQDCERSSDSSPKFSAGHHQRRYPDFNACFNACFNTQELSAIKAALNPAELRLIVDALDNKPISAAKRGRGGEGGVGKCSRHIGG